MNTTQYIKHQITESLKPFPAYCNKPISISPIFLAMTERSHISVNGEAPTLFEPSNSLPKQVMAYRDGSFDVSKATFTLGMFAGEYSFSVLQLVDAKYDADENAFIVHASGDDYVLKFLTVH